MFLLCFHSAIMLRSAGLKRSDILRVIRVMTAFFTTGVDGVHLSAGTEDGNSCKRQVELGPSCLYR